MAQQFNQQNIKIRTSVLVFIKGSSAPLVLYLENPQEFYNELNQIMKSPNVTFIEKELSGPLKKVCFASNQISAIALQEEQYV